MTVRWTVRPRGDRASRRELRVEEGGFFIETYSLKMDKTEKEGETPLFALFEIIHSKEI